MIQFVSKEEHLAIFANNIFQSMVSFLPHPHENEDPKVLKISTLAAVFRFLCLFDDEFLRFCVDERAKQKKMFAFIKYPHIYPELWGQDLIYFLALFMCVTH